MFVQSRWNEVIGTRVIEVRKGSDDTTEQCLTKYWVLEKSKIFMNEIKKQTGAMMKRTVVYYPLLDV